MVTRNSPTHNAAQSSGGASSCAPGGRGRGGGEAQQARAPAQFAHTLKWTSVAASKVSKGHPARAVTSTEA